MEALRENLSSSIVAQKKEQTELFINFESFAIKHCLYKTEESFIN